MEEKLNELLPIGSVVLLNNAEKKLIIMGVIQMQPEKKKIYDYMGVVYPEGFMNLQSCFLFNQEDISEIVFYGYKDKEREDYLDILKTMFKTAEEQVNLKSTMKKE